MWQKIKMLILKITFSPIWISVLLLVLFLHGFNITFRMGWQVKSIKDIFEYWRLQMWQKIKCWLGWHEWDYIERLDHIDDKGIFYYKLDYVKCKHCGKVKR